MAVTYESLLAGTIGSGLFSVVSLIPVYWRKRFLKHGVTVEGLIVGEQESDASDGIYYPIVQFRTLEGREMVVEANETDAGRMPIGKKVTVSYWPSNPHRIYILEHSYVGLWIMFSMGILVMLIFLHGLIMFPNH